MVSPAIVIIVMCIMEYGKLSISIDQTLNNWLENMAILVAWLNGHFYFKGNSGLFLKWSLENLTEKVIVIIYSK